MLEYYRFKVINDLFIKGLTEEARLQLTELQKRYVELCEENASLRTQVQEFGDIFFLARNFVFDGSFYWLITGSIKQGPFCPTCYNKDGLLVRLTDMFPRRCASCGDVFERGRGLSKSVQEVTPRALEQSAMINSLRAFATMEQFTPQEEAAVGSDTKPEPVRPKAKIIPFTK